MVGSHARDAPDGGADDSKDERPHKRARLTADAADAGQEDTGGRSDGQQAGGGGDEDVVMQDEAARVVTDDGLGQIKQRRIAVVCASNMNRSMQAHYVLQQLEGFPNVYSYGTGSSVKLPGPSADQPNIYPFETPYADIKTDLEQKDFKLYTRNGLLSMLERNISCKEFPQSWQRSLDKFEIVVTFEERVFDAVLADLLNRDAETNEPVHVFNLETEDNHTASVAGSELLLKLLQRLNMHQDWEEDVEEIVFKFEQAHDVQILHAIAFY